MEGRWTASGVSTDSRSVSKGDLFFAIKGERFDGHDFVAEAFDKGAAGAVVCRPVRLPGSLFQERCVRVPDTRKALGLLARHHMARWPGQVIAVTGSNGKTTTKDMIHHVLSGRFNGIKSPASFNNEIGLPLTVFQLRPKHGFAVLEMGASAPGDIARLADIAGPHVGLVTNVGETHLRDLYSVKGVARAKAELLEALQHDGLAILNADDPITPWLRKWAQCRVLTFGSCDAADFRAVNVRSEGWGARFQLSEGTECFLPMPGVHNVFNALAAIAAGSLWGISPRQAACRLRSFRPQHMRLAREEVDGVTLINDAYNANLRSMCAALKVLDSLETAGRRVMLAGDMLELGMKAAAMHRELGIAIGESRVDVLVTVGSWAWRAGETARRYRDGLELHQCNKSERAVERLVEVLGPGDVLLVKGSRAMHLEKTLEAVKQQLLGRTGRGSPLEAGPVPDSNLSSANG